MMMQTRTSVARMTTMKTMRKTLICTENIWGRLEELKVITDPHPNLLFSLGIISTNAESKITHVEFVKFCSTNSLM